MRSTWYRTVPWSRQHEPVSDRRRHGHRKPFLNVHLVLEFMSCGCSASVCNIWPRLKAMDRIEAQRAAIATVHSFRFFGLVFILPGVAGWQSAGLVSPTSPLTATSRPGCLPLLALLTVRIRPAHSFGCSSSPSISWGRPTSSATITTPSSWTFQHMQGSLAPYTRSRSSTCRY